MKPYRSHKVVEAGKIYGWRVSHSERMVSYVTLANDEIVEVPREIFDRSGPTEIDFGYLVRYPDGYLSWSPTKAFEEGYTEVGDSGPEQAPNWWTIRRRGSVLLDAVIITRNRRAAESSLAGDDFELVRFVEFPVVASAEIGASLGEQTFVNQVKDTRPPPEDGQFLHD